MKKKLLWWGDSPTVSTGFGTVSKNLLDYLSQYYEVAVLGINEYGLTRYDSSKYFIYPIERMDIFGFNRFKIVVNDFRPDLIVLFQDIWCIYSLIERERELFVKIPYAIYFPIDARPFSRVWKDTILGATKAITYTNWGKEIIQETIPEAKEIFCITHGIDSEIFHPLPPKTIKYLRDSYGWKNKFIITNVNRFQPRKYVTQTLRIASLFIKGYKICECGNWYPVHYKSCDLNGCKNVVGEGAGHPDAALYLHMNTKEGMMGQFPSDFLTSHALNNGFSSADMGNSLFLLGSQIYSKNELPPSELNNLYNASNVMLSTSLGEGFGLTTGEAMATGTPVIVGKHTANFELTNNGEFGDLVENEALMGWGGDNGHCRPIMNVKSAYASLLKRYERFAGEKEPDLRLAEHIQKNFVWKNEAHKFYEIINKIK